MDTFNIKCCDEQHAVYLSPRGDAVFHDHPGVSTSLMATEYQINPTVGGCFLVAHALREQSNHAGSIPLWVLKRVEAMNQKRQRRRPEEAVADIPYETVPVHHRVLLYQHPLLRKAEQLLNKAQFRTSKVAHRVEVHPAGGMSSVVGSSESVPDAIMKKGKLFAGRRQVVRLYLNIRQWASVALRGAGLTQTFFVTEVLRTWSKNELEVYALKQSTGYQVLVRKAVIRRAHDGIWRMYEWL